MQLVNSHGKGNLWLSSTLSVAQACSSWVQCLSMKLHGRFTSPCQKCGYCYSLLRAALLLLKVDMETARNKELQFFKANPRYADLKNIGMNFLSTKLSNHLIGAIRRQLPAIQNQINTGV